jgi:hypothetical protein
MADPPLQFSLKPVCQGGGIPPSLYINPTFPKQLCVVRRLPVFVGVLNADGAVGYTIIDFASILHRF